MNAELIGALAASVYGCCTVFRKKTPLFYKIVFFAMLMCLMGNVYSFLYDRLWLPDALDFHVGHLGTFGMFFFLLSSYYGAIDSLADGKQPSLAKYRMTALLLALVFFVGSVIAIYAFDKGVWTYLMAVPVSFTFYFAFKHLIIPDIEMGIIKVMRPYNALIVCLCVSMTLGAIVPQATVPAYIADICTGILLVCCMPTARNGVRKWFT